MNEIAELLEDAADFIEEKGWYQGGFGNLEGPTCAWGAILSTFQRHPEADRVDHRDLIRNLSTTKTGSAYRALDTYLRQYFPDTELFSVPYWNDTPGRTKEEILDALRGAAKAVAIGQIDV